MIFFPIVTFSIYAISNIADFDISRAFAGLSIISLMSMPLLDVISSIPQVTAAATCFGRIQSFLMEDECRGSGADTFQALEQEDLSDFSAEETSSKKLQIPKLEVQCVPPVELRDIPHLIPEPLQLVRPYRLSPSESVVTVSDADFAASPEQSPVLKDINLNCSLGSLTAVVGPTGSGKTMLLQSLLGESVLLKGSMIRKLDDIAYCGQETWLSNTTIQENILFGHAYDSAWYETVLRALLLDQDIIKFDLGDKTWVGSAGTNLSGGQKQRVVSAE